MLKEQKVKIVEELADDLSKSPLVLLTDYKGLSVAEITKLRDELYEVGAKYRVAKNTLIKLALEKAGVDSEELKSSLEGTTALLYTEGDAVLALKVLFKFIKEVKKPEVRCGVMDGRFITAEEAKEFSTLPPREVLLAQLVGQMQAPIYGLHAVLSGTLRKLLYALNAIKEKKD
jgi:large subunit ribosomal protein L10